MNDRFNLSAWALSHRALVLALLIAAVAVGMFSYLSLGRAEDPSFTIKVMTIRTEWPGATARQVEQLVTDPIQRKLEELPYYDHAESYSRPGESVVFLSLKDSTPPAAVAGLWYQTRKKIGDIRDTLPSGIAGPYFNDEFGDVYSTIYAVAGDGYEPETLRKIAEELREHLREIPGVGKIDLIGVQPQAIYVEVSSQRLADFNLSIDQVIAAIRNDNDVMSAGRVDVGSDRIFMRVDDGLDTLAAARALPIAVNGRQFALSDIADLSRGYADPKTYTMRVNGKDAVGIGVVMTKGGDVIRLGHSLDEKAKELQRTLPAGVSLSSVADQGHIVSDLIDEFQVSLAEALVIVMAVSFLSLGWRAGMVVAFAVPLVLCLTFAGMALLGIDFHRVSAGALIISLGLLVDDAIIAVEMMMVKIEQGWDRVAAGAFAYRSTAFPMLTGTIVTAAGFVAVAFAKSGTAEFTASIFWVVGLALGISWLVAVLFTPYLGFYLLPVRHGASSGHQIYDRPIYRRLRAAITLCLEHRRTVVALTAGLFVLAIAGFALVPQQFFPSSDRPELLVDVRLAEGSSFAATAAEVTKLEKRLVDDPDVDKFVAYTGGGSPRFYLPLDQQLQTSNFAQFVVVAKSLAQRDTLRRRLEASAETEFPAARLRVITLEVGPPVGYLVQFRVNGADPDRIRGIAHQVRDVMREDPAIRNLNLQWDELSKRVRVIVDPNKAEALGVSKAALSSALDLMLSGRAVTQYREGTQLIDVVLRTPRSERLDLAGLGDLSVPTSSGGAVALRQVATLAYEQEEPVLWRRGRETMLTVRADVMPGVQAPAVSQRLDRSLDALRATLPEGYRIDMGGAIAESAKGQGAIFAMVPVMVLIMLMTLMIQLQSFRRVALVVLTAPLGIIGVTAALLLTGYPFGFVALLGVIALAGIIMRNSVILVGQIDQDIREGHAPWIAIVDATVRRARPIALTALAAILGLIPLARSVFWGPMAAAMMGGILVATLLTLTFVPALYALWYGVEQEIRLGATGRNDPLAVPAE